MLALALACAAVLAQAPEPGSKKDRYLAAKLDSGDGDGNGRPARAGQRADPPIWAHNLRTHEIRALTGPAGIRDGELGQPARSEFFRCWFTEKTGPIPAELVAQMIAAARQFGVREIRIISGFRHAKYNLSLVKKGREVARSSEHTDGHALDFFLPGIGTRALYEWLLDVHPGGVGFYPNSEFVHIDIGRKRTWTGS